MRADFERAEEYARLLAPGSEIIDDTDGPVVRDMMPHLRYYLFRRGLFLQRLEDRWVVVASAPWAVKRLRRPMPPVWCCRCSRSLFDSACEHGVRHVIDLGEPVWPSLSPKAAMVLFLVARPGGRA
jgi:hypothetical protein